MNSAKTSSGGSAQLSLHHRRGQFGSHRRRVGLQPGHRRLVDALSLRGHQLPERDEGQHLPGLHQHALGVAQHCGVALAGPLVELGAVLTGQPLAQGGDHRLTGGAAGQPGQGNHAAQPISTVPTGPLHCRSSVDA